MKIDCKLRIEYRAAARANSRMREKASLVIEKDQDRKWDVPTILYTYSRVLSLIWPNNVVTAESQISLTTK